jgi:hypothetical protein
MGRVQILCSFLKINCKKMPIRNLNLILVCIVLFACSSQNEKKGIIDLRKCLKENTKVYLSEIANEIEYITLENNEQSYLGEIGQLKFFKDRIVLVDSKMNCIHIFNNTGKHIKKISSVGKGPKDYISIGWIDVSLKDSCIYLLDNETSNLLKFNQDGKFVNRWRIEGRPTAFDISNDNITFLYVFPNSVYNNNFSISIFDRALTRHEKRIKSRPITEDKAFVTSATGDFLFAKSCDTLTYWEYKNDIIYKITGTKIYEAYKIIYPNSLTNDSKNNNLSSYTTIYSVYESCNYLFLFGDYKSNPYRIVYDKRTKKAIKLSLKDADKLNYGFINDIDGGYTFYPEGVTLDGRVYMKISLWKLKEYLGSKKLKNLKVVNSSKLKELQKLINSSTIEDNECIMLVTLK